MKTLILILPFFVSFSLKSQPSYSVRDINAKGHFQIENVSSTDLNDWLNFVKSKDYKFSYFDQDNIDSYNNIYNYTEGNASLAMNMSVFRNSKLQEDTKVTPHWQFSLMFVRENIGSYYNQGTETTQGIETSSLNLNYINNLFRVEVMRLWRTDDSKKAFVAFGLGTQLGMSYDSQIEIFEYQSSQVNNTFSGFNSSSGTIEAKKAMTSMLFLPIDVNVRIVENLFMQLELRTGMKNLLVFDGPSLTYPVYGIGIGTRYVL